MIRTVTVALLALQAPRWARSTLLVGLKITADARQFLLFAWSAAGLAPSAVTTSA